MLRQVTWDAEMCNQIQFTLNVLKQIAVEITETRFRKTLKTLLVCWKLQQRM